VSRAMALGLVAVLLLEGCGPGRFMVNKVDQNQPTVEGFRYFLPRPYLLVTNMVIAPTPTVLPSGGGGGGGGAGGGGAGAGGTGGATGGGGSHAATPGTPPGDGTAPSPPIISTVTLQVVWLPDYSQEYAVSVEGGRAGSFNGALQLANGWMLIGVNQQNVSGTAETMQAVSGFLGTLFSAAGLGTAAAGAKAAAAQVVEAQVPPKPFLLLFRINNNNTLEEVSTCRVNELLARAGAGTLVTNPASQCPKPTQ